MIHLSKSKYCALWQCPKMFWLRKYKPEAGEIDQGAAAHMETGNQVGDLAMGLFGNFVEVTCYDGDKLDLKRMIEETAEEMAKGTENICEASFSYNGLYCAVDILRREGDGWAIYEVKSSTDSDEPKDVYIADIAYQKYVLEHCGVKVTGTSLVRMNHQYVFDGTLDIRKLFSVMDVSGLLPRQSGLVEANIAAAERLLSSDTEPDISISERCSNPYTCGFWNYCTRDVPEQSVFDLYRMPFAQKLEYYRSGMVEYKDLINAPSITNEKQLRQMEYALADRGTYVDVDAVREFMGALSYPLYFLDFETMQPAVPQYVGTRPYQQIPFQYSLHYILSEGGELEHKEFLGVSGTDPRRALAEQLCADIPMNVCTTAYNKAFECSRIKEMADAFPDLAEHLLNIRENIVDLLVPFQSGYYYNRAMGGSFSIKSVLPAIYPDDPALNYHNLEEIHNGSEAMSIFPRIKDMKPEEQEVARRNLLKYCELDTYAMVKVWEELKRVVSD